MLAVTREARGALLSRFRILYTVTEQARFRVFMSTTKDKHTQFQQAYYAGRYADVPGRNAVWQELCAYMQQYMPANAEVLDIGAGYCSFINNITAAGKHALDIYPGFTQYAGAGVTVHAGSCCAMTMFPAEKFDVVFASNLLEHLTADETAPALNEIIRVLKPGGSLLLMQPNFRYAGAAYFDDHTHRQIFTHVGLAGLLEAAGFRIEKVVPRFIPFSFKSRLPAWRWLVAIYVRMPIRPFARQMFLVARKPGAEAGTPPADDA